MCSWLCYVTAAGWGQTVWGSHQHMTARANMSPLLVSPSLPHQGSARGSFTEPHTFPEKQSCVRTVPGLWIQGFNKPVCGVTNCPGNPTATKATKHLPFQLPLSSLKANCEFTENHKEGKISMYLPKSKKWFIWSKSIPPMTEPLRYPKARPTKIWERLLIFRFTLLARSWKVGPRIAIFSP